MKNLEETSELERDIIYELNEGTTIYSKLVKKIEISSRSKVWNTILSLNEQGIVNIDKDLKDLRKNNLTLNKQKIVIKKAWREYTLEYAILWINFAFIFMISVFYEKPNLFYGILPITVVLLLKYLLDTLRTRKNTLIFKRR